MSRNKQKPGMPKRSFSVQQLAGISPAIEAVGKKWRIGFNDQDAKGALEDLVRTHVISREVKVKRQMGPEEGERYWREEVRPLLESGYYDTFAKGWLAVLNSSDGVMLFLQSLLMKAHPDITRAQTEEIFVAEPEQVMAAVEVVAPDFFASVAIQKGYSSEDAKAAAPIIAESIVKAIAEHKKTFGATQREPDSPSLTATT